MVTKCKLELKTKTMIIEDDRALEQVKKVGSCAVGDKEVIKLCRSNSILRKMMKSQSIG